MRKLYFVYITMSDSGVALYTGVTNDLSRRLREHRMSEGESFAARYRTTRLVWFEVHREVDAAIAREKQIKSWRRRRKEALIRSMNPQLRDLSEEAARSVAEREFWCG